MKSLMRRMSAQQPEEDQARKMKTLFGRRINVELMMNHLQRKAEGGRRNLLSGMTMTAVQMFA